GLERGVRELLRGAEEDGVGAETGDEDVAVRSDVYTFRAQREVTYSVAAGGLQCRRCLSHHGTRLFRWESGGAGQRAQVRAGDGPGDDVGGRLVGADVQDGDQSVVVDERGAACRVQHVGDLRPR